MMKEVLCLVLFGILFMSTVSARDCTSDAGCSSDECCVEYFPYFKSCKDKPDDVGDTCLGQFNCDCKSGLTCELHDPSIYNIVKFGLGKCRRN